MKGYRITRPAIAGITSSPLISQKKTFWISSIIALTAFFTGLFFSFCLSAPDKENLAGPVLAMIREGTGSASSSLGMNLFLLLLIMLIGLSVYGAVLTLLLLGVKALSAGFCAGLIYYGSGSLKFIILSLIPVNIFRLVIFSAACAICINYALSVMHSNAQDTSRQQYFTAFAVLAAAVLLSSFGEHLTFCFT